MKTILMIPSWYPTKENPFAGSFFREQAIALQENFKIIILLLNFNKSAILKKPKFSFIEDDDGLSVYRLTLPRKKTVLLDFLYNKIRCRKESKKEGIGFYERPSHEKRLEKSLEYIKNKNLLPKFDCVYGLTAQDNASVARLFSVKYKVPYVVAEHAPFPWPGSTVSDKISNAIENADSFFAISQDKIRQVMLQNIRIKPCYVGNLCDENRFALSKENHDTKTFLIVASNSFYKNYPMFIKTMEELKKISVKDFKIIMAGYRANKGYSKNVEELENTVKESSIKDFTTMIKSVSREDIPKVYNSCDALVITSIQEGLPINALEASMSGLPIFSTRCGGVEDYIDDDMGRIVSIYDYETLAKHCNDFLNGKITFDAVKIREKCISLFGKKSFTSRMSKEFNRVINEYSK